MSKMSRLLIKFVFSFLCFSKQINGQGFYSILAPNTIRPNSEFHVSVGMHQTPEPTTVKLGIISETYSNFKTVEVRPYSNELVQFEINDLKRDRYSLTVEGISGLIFTNETRLQYQSKQLSVFVQTDKAVYKPGDLIRYRVLILDSNMKPAKYYGDVNIEIKDGNKNLIKPLNNIKLTSSIYSDELQLATEFPVLGEWSINVEVIGEIYTKYFEVAEYAMSKFQVHIDTPKDAVYSDGKITATIRANYHFGKPIKGEATVTIYPKFYGAIQPFVFNLITRKVININGKGYVEFDIKNELNFHEDYKRDILVEAVVEEQLSGRKQNTTTIVTLHRDLYKIETLRIPEYYVPNVPFEMLIRIVQYDDTPLRDPKSNPVIAYWTKSLSDTNNNNKTEFKLNNQGIAKLRITIPKTDDNYQKLIIVSYLDVSTEIGMVEKKQTKNNSYIQASILNENLMVNEEVNVAVQSSERMNYFMYQVAGRGDILISKTVEVADSNYHTFKFIASSAMIPKATLMVFFVLNDGELIYDELSFDFGDELSNFVRLESPTKSLPGQEVDITITTKPFSYIGLMAVDQNANNIRMGNDLTREVIFKELMKYDADKTSIFKGVPGHDSGVLLLTNSDYFVNKTVQTRKGKTLSDDQDDENTLVKKTDIGPAHLFEVNTRPPLAGPYAFSRIPKPFWNRPRVHVMSEIFDTWLFLNISSGNEGRTTIHKKLPFAMTSWVLSAFSLDPITGLGLSKPPKNVEYYKSFYIATDLPYSIKRNEIISIPFVVFNNQNYDIETEVTMYNTGQDFEFVYINNELKSQPKVELFSRKSVKIAANSADSVSFAIRPNKLGHIIIKAVAASQLAGDTIERTLLVEPEGAIETVNRGIFIDLRSKSEEKDNVTIEIPRNAVEDSVHIEVSVVGDILGSTIKNLEQLIQLPNSGTGEQNMLNFMPNVLILNYLTKIQKLSPAIEAKAKKSLDIGYQRQLFYRHKDGSFSSFGPSTDKAGSIWLTAFVARSFKQASEYVQINESIIKSALEFLKANQASDGSFRMKRDNSSVNQNPDDISLTAFTLLAFLENSSNIPEYRNVINKAIDFIVRGLAISDELYSLAISAYALSVAGHNSKNAFVQRLDTFAKYENGKKWYVQEYPTSEKANPWYNKTRSINVEITSYAALALLQNNLLNDAMPILKWLVNERSSLGGFVSSKDTIVGLEALIKFDESLPNRNTNVQIIFGYNSGVESRMNVNDDNALVLQSYQLPPSVKNVTISASGRGLALAQVSYRYNTNVTGAWPRFSLDPQVNRISHANYLHLSICASFVTVPGGANKSNLAVMEVHLPSGFTVDLDTLPSIEANERIKKVETIKRDSVVIIYFDYLDRKEICPTLDAYKTHKVTKHRSVPIIMYDAYDNARRARIFYNAPKSTICDICEGNDCGNSCGPLGQRHSRILNDKNNNDVKIAGSDGDAGSAITLPTTLIISLIILRNLI